LDSYTLSKVKIYYYLVENLQVSNDVRIS